MIRRPPRSTRAAPLLPYTTLVQSRRLVLSGQRLEGGLGGQHAGLHGIVAALDLRDVEEAGRAADQRAAGKHQLRQRLQPALVQRAGAVGDALAARSEEHTSELQSLMRHSYAVFCLKKKKKDN